MKAVPLLAAVLGLVLASPAFAEDPVGDWAGQLAGGFKVAIHVEKAANGAYTGTMKSPNGEFNRLDEVTVSQDQLRFSAAKLDLTYDGAWDPGQKAWVGNLVRGRAYALTLKRSDSASQLATLRKRPQEEAIASTQLPYDQVEVSFENPAAHVRLAGTFSLPKGAGPFPAIVLVSGTGQNTRDEDVYGHKVFLVLADALNRRGVAVLRYDKRGVGGSTGGYDQATTADFASDARAAVDWLKTQAKVDRTHIGVLGHSEGGVIAPMVAAQDRDVAFVIMIAGPAVRGDRLFVLQSALTAQAYGAPEDYVSRRRVFDEKLYTAVTTAPTPGESLTRARTITDQGLAEKLIDPQEAASLPADTTNPWMRYFLVYDPAPTLKRLTAPILALNGSLDLQVPAKENLTVVREALKNNKDATILELPGLNHLLQDAATGSPAEYDAIDETMSPSALKIITDWVAVHSK
jgi:uncharacterized protein